jgi:hypothetical protein
MLLIEGIQCPITAVISGALEAIMLDLDGQLDFGLRFGSEVLLLSQTRQRCRTEKSGFQPFD